jgi:hypothetical protein
MDTKTVLKKWTSPDLVSCDLRGWSRGSRSLTVRTLKATVLNKAMDAITQSALNWVLQRKPTYFGSSMYPAT